MAVKRTKAPKKCLGCKEEKKIQARGICASCYQLLRNAVAGGDTTWDAAEKAGVCLPAGTVAQGRYRFSQVFPQLVPDVGTTASPPTAPRRRA